MRGLFRWAELCYCHGFIFGDSSEEDDVKFARAYPHYEDDPAFAEMSVQEMRRFLNQWLSCPLRGLRLAELSAGDVFNVVRDLFGSSVVQLRWRLQADPLLSEASLNICLIIFERAKNHVLFTLVLKICPFQVVPY